ncbi:hypothetical protein ACI1MP_05440 [Kitasatospora griseola]|uniref:hypothetical protein n=1 Tax=Kitasatospora griseola TaxID=2064 RepID=UPI003855F6E8
MAFTGVVFLTIGIVFITASERIAEFWRLRLKDVSPDRARKISAASMMAPGFFFTVFGVGLIGCAAYFIIR